MVINGQFHKNFLQKIVGACSVFILHEGYTSVTPLDAAEVDRTIFPGHYVRLYYITRIEGKDRMKHDIII